MKVFDKQKCHFSYTHFKYPLVAHLFVPHHLFFCMVGTTLMVPYPRCMQACSRTAFHHHANIRPIRMTDNEQ